MRLHVLTRLEVLREVADAVDGPDVEDAARQAASAPPLREGLEVGARCVVVALAGLADDRVEGGCNDEEVERLDFVRGECVVQCPRGPGLGCVHVRPILVRHVVILASFRTVARWTMPAMGAAAESNRPLDACWVLGLAGDEGSLVTE